MKPTGFDGSTNLNSMMEAAAVKSGSGPATNGGTGPQEKIRNVPKKRHAADLDPAQIDAIAHGSKDTDMPALAAPRVKQPKLTDASSSPSLGQIPIAIPRYEAACPMCGQIVWGIGTLSKHLAKRHANRTVCYVCRKCGKQSPNCHSIACHFPKCNIPTSPLRMGLSCSMCSKSFATKRGVSQHARLAHPLQWNSHKATLYERKFPSLQIDDKGDEYNISIIKRMMLELKGCDGAPALIAETIGGGMTKEQVVMEWEENCTRGRTKVWPRKNLWGVGPKNPRPSAWRPGLSRDTVKERFLTNLRENLIGKNKRTMKAIIKLAMRDNTDEESSDRYVRLLAKLLGTQRKAKCTDIERQTMVVGATTSKHRRLRKVANFKTQQLLYKSDRTTLAHVILDGRESMKCTIPMVDVYNAFREKWQQYCVYKGLGPFRSIGGASNEVLYKPVIPKEIVSNLSAMKNGTAPGPDGITKGNIIKWNIYAAALAVEYTKWLIRGSIPPAIKACVTRLIPKNVDADNLADITNWRPITIGSMLLRLFSRILTARLTQACPVNPRQTGFMSDASGCADNLMILDKLISSSRGVDSTLAVVFIDIAKAFDSVSHAHILHALEKRGLDHHILGLIQSTYEGCATRICRGNDSSDPILIQAGVKQGDPMSPLLFNLAMDPLIQYLEDSNYGLERDGMKISTLAFADDIVLLSDSRKGMRGLLGALSRFCRLTGLKVQPQKCGGFICERGLLNRGRPWLLEGLPIKWVGPDETVKYLGVPINPIKGVVSPDLKEAMLRWLTNIKTAYLKPSQRIFILNTFAVPRVIYQAVMGKVPITHLAEVDRVIRVAVKDWLHLAPSTNNGLLYSRNRDGGLGLLRLEKLVPSIRMKCVWKMCSSKDEWARFVAREAVTRPEWERLWKSVGGSPGLLPKFEVRPEGADGADNVQPLALPCWRDRENQEWEQVGTYGKSVPSFRNDKISNTWLRDPEVVSFSQKQYLMGLAMRVGAVPAICSRMGLSSNKVFACKRCNASHESLSHVLGQCAYVKTNIIRRHNKVCDDLQEEMEKHGWDVVRESRLTDSEGKIMAPDIVALRNGFLLIIDVTVRFETSDFPLELAAEEKVRKYTSIGGMVKRMVNAKRYKVMGFPLGARGKWPKCNDAVLKVIGMPADRRLSFAKFLSRRVLLYSMDVVRGFYV